MEMAEQSLLALLAHAGNAVQDTLPDLLCAKGAMIGDREAMGFVAHPLKQVERAGMLGQ
jgi:hypothetical protein